MYLKIGPDHSKTRINFIFDFKFILTIFFFLVIWPYGTGFCQKSSQDSLSGLNFGKINYHKPVNLIKYPSKRGTELVAAFVDTSQKKIRSMLDVRKANPYIDLDLPKEKDLNYQDNPIYIVADQPLSEAFPGIRQGHYTDNIDSTIITNLTSFQNAIYFNNYVLVVYEQRAFSGDMMMAAMATVIVYDSLGNVISKLPDINYNVLDLEITKNGKYVALQYGLNTEDETMLQTGVCVYNTGNGKMLLDETGKYIGFFCMNNYVIVGHWQYKSSGRYKLLEVYDFDKKKKYSKLFTFDEYVRLGAVTDEGYIYRNTDGSTTTLYFNKQFKVDSLWE